ncbi:MAG: type II toxin-antitoxin system antitoxin SocA domain-containing protein [Cyanobacteria bacterium P01_E01_bin.42]
MNETETLALSQRDRQTITAREVADYFLSIARESDRPINIYKLQKLTYYAQAWYLGLYELPLFEEDFQAWVHGPILPELFKIKRDWQPITQFSQKPNFPLDVQEFLEEVWQVYGEHNSEELERMTCSESPWQNVRKNLPRDEPCHKIIPKISLHQYYSRRAEEEEEPDQESSY